MQLMNSSLDKLVKNLSDEDFKYLIEELGSENLELLKQKGAYPYEYMNSFERFNEEKLPARKYFLSSSEKGKISNDSKKSDSHISFKDYLTCEKMWDKFEMKNASNYRVTFRQRVRDMIRTYSQISTCQCLTFILILHQSSLTSHPNSI